MKYIFCESYASDSRDFKYLSFSDKFSGSAEDEDYLE